MTAVNAFNWQSYTDEERSRRGNPIADLERCAAISKRTSVSVEKIRKTTPSHGTVFGLTEKVLRPNAVKMIKRGNGEQLHFNQGKK